MDSIDSLFSLICGREHVFVVDGTPLPLCQRCLGLYLGSMLTGLWLAASGIWRRGLPDWSVFIVNTVVLLAAGVGGLHLVDGGPTWRVTAGLWTGYVLTLWLAGAIVHLAPSSWLRRPVAQSWRGSEKLQAVALAALMPLVAGLLPALLWPGVTFWSGVALIGATLLAVLILAGLALCVHFCFVQLTFRAREALR
jgi:uncharacterized membrane protein